MERAIRKTVIVSVAIALGVIMVSAQPTQAAWVVYRDRAAWTAALGGAVVEDVDTVAGTISLGTTTINTLTYTSPGSMPDASGNTTLVVSGNVNGSPCLTWSGSTGSVRYTEMTLPGSFSGVGVDWYAQSPSTDSDGRPHNSFYFLVSGNSGELPGTFAGVGVLVNDEDYFGVGNVPQTGFFGAIDTSGGITSFQVGSYWTNYQSFGADNFSYGPAGSIVPEPATMSLLALGGLGALIRRKKRQ